MIEYIDSAIVRMMQLEEAYKNSLNALHHKKPEFTIRKEKGMVKIYFSNFEGDVIKVYSRRPPENSFVYLGETTEPLLIDGRSNLFKAPELREYKAIYFKNNEQIGTISDSFLIIKKNESVQ